MAKPNQPDKDDPRYAVCMRAVTVSNELRKSMDEFRDLCARSGVTMPDLDGQFREVMDSAAEAFRTCDRRNQEVLETTCAETLCPMAAANVAAAGMGMAVAMLRLQASTNLLTQKPKTG